MKQALGAMQSFPRRRVLNLRILSLSQKIVDEWTLATHLSGLGRV
jgi:hypothetical protein